MIKLTRLYYEALQGFRGKSFGIIILSAASGLFEGIAITVLMPLLNESLKFYKTSSFELFGKAYRIHDRRILIFGIIGVFCFLGVLSSCLKLWMESRALKLRIALERTYNERLVEAVLKTKWTHFLTVRFGDLSKAINMESRNIAHGAMGIISMLGLMITAAIFLTIGYGLSPRMTFVTLLFGSLILILHRNSSARYSKDSSRVSTISSDINHEINQLLGNMKFMRSTGLGPYVMTRMSASFRDYEEAFLSLNLYSHLMRFSFELAGLLFVSVFIVYSAWQDPAALGRVVLFLVIFYRLAPRLASIQEQYGRALNEQGWYLSWRKLTQTFSDHADTEPADRGLLTPQFTATLGAMNMGFSYPTRPILKNINWSLRKGHCLAVVGESGSGKTTLIDLLSGLLQPTQGQLLLDNQPFNKMNVRHWQQQIGLVMQNSPIFHTTVLENIAWGDPSPNEEQALEATKRAHASEFISRLPKGMNTLLGDKGASLSAGECQRIALARALYRKPWLLILDEATNALDAESETIIQETLLQLKGHVTLFMVAHRLNTVRLADEILVLADGEIAERGTYTDLLRMENGRFRKLAHLQGLL